MSTSPSTHLRAGVTPVQRRARVAASAGFATQGFVFAMVLTSLTAFKDRYGIGDLTIAAVILGVCVMAGVGTFLADRVARTSGGSRAVLTAGLGVVAAAVVVVSTAPVFAVLAVGFAIYGVGLGMVDAGTNMQAVAIQRDYGRSLLTGFYAAWSAGGILGTVAIAVSTDRVPTDPVALVLLSGSVVAVAVAVLVAARGRRDEVPLHVETVAVVPSVDAAVPAATASASTSGPTRPDIPWAPLLVLGLAVVAYYVNDQAISTWSPIFMDEVLSTTGTLTKLGYAAYLAMTLVSRLAGDPCVRRWGRARVVRVAAIVGSAGLLLVLTAQAPEQAILGFAVAGAGLGLIAPLCFSAAESLAPGHADAVVARLNGFNYVGAVLGGVFVGAVGSASNLRWGFAIPAVLVLAVAVLAGRFGSLHPADRDAPATAHLPGAGA
ncbi:MFS transporter [Cellulomonas chitinilytica]|uniref:MFS transporter n=1 Tax=Cellulomonas chitinilytica TaxID=398759 RepID=A0A919P746_9CELL|nr:MFS transporter [Cellulomonas chitinilytica]GIG22534.1 MFS transporter [Cellulomonas chitinilytica]